MNIYYLAMLFLAAGTATCSSFEWDYIHRMYQPLKAKNVKAYLSINKDIHLFWKANDTSKKALIYQRLKSNGEVIREKLIDDDLWCTEYEPNPAQVSDEGDHIVVVYRKRIFANYGPQILLKESFDGGETWSGIKVVFVDSDKNHIPYTVLLEKDTGRVYVFYLDKNSLYGIC